MAEFLAIANRKGGVGKSTIAVMLAHAAAAWSGRRVLVMDLDTQCNASLMLVGGEGWSKARRAGKTISDYFYDRFDKVAEDESEYVLKQAKAGKDPDAVALDTRTRMKRLMKHFGMDFDLVILDCPPGLSFAALAALDLADKVVVPFRPDYVSEFALDRVALLIERVDTADDLADIPFAKRRYVCLPNYLRNTGRENMLIDQMALDHPMLKSRVPLLDSVARAFDWDETKKSMEQKYGDALPHLRALHDEVLGTRLALAKAG